MLHHNSRKTFWFPYCSSHGTPGAAAFAGGGFAAGAVSAATGALAAKAVSDRSERRAIEERLAEVKRDLEGLGFGKMGICELRYNHYSSHMDNHNHYMSIIIIVPLGRT